MVLTHTGRSLLLKRVPGHTMKAVAEAAGVHVNTARNAFAGRPITDKMITFAIELAGEDAVAMATELETTTTHNDGGE